jgi:Uma2 family endonuclease
LRFPELPRRSGAASKWVGRFLIIAIPDLDDEIESGPRLRPSPRPPLPGKPLGVRMVTRHIYLVNSYLEQNDLGICVGADGMMRIAPGLVRIPDMSFITWDRLPGRQSPREPIPALAPDLAVEVLSEGNTKPEMARKVREYFDAGVILVWLINPRKRTARVFSTVEKSVLLRADQALDGGKVLPGFVPTLSDLFDRGRQPRLD